MALGVGVLPSVFQGLQPRHGFIEFTTILLNITHVAVAFGKKTDPSGAYIRKYVPKLAKYPDKYIFEPWEAPMAVQKVKTLK